MVDYVFSYCLSNLGNQVKELKRSIKSLSRFIDKDHIIVIQTPPYLKMNDLMELEKVSRILKRDNLTEPFKFNYRRYGRFGEKFQCLNLEYETLVFLDNDTYVNRNPLALIDSESGSFGIAARIDNGWFNYDINKWYETIKIPMLNTGVMVFKHGVHRVLYETLISSMNTYIPRYSNAYFHKDQIVFSKLLSDTCYKIKYLTSNDVAYLWEADKKHNAIIHHGEYKPLWRFLVNDVIKQFYNYYWR